MNKVKFNDIFDFIRKSNLKASDEEKNGKFPFYTSSNIVTKRTNNPMYNETSLVIGNGGVANIHYADSPFAATSHCYIAVANNSNVNTKYVYHYLSANIHVLESGFKGAGLRNISSKYIGNIEIPLPDIEIQNKVVAVLDKAKSIIDKREQTLSFNDELIRSTFLDTFGDSVLNPRGWEKATLNALCIKIIDCPHETPDYTNATSEFYCIRSSDIQGNYIDFTETKTVSEETFLQRIVRHQPKQNEVIYTREGGRLGNAARVPATYNICLGQRMMLFIANDKVSTNEFIWALLNSDSIKQLVLNMSAGGAAPRINIGQLRNLEVINPSLELQRQFASKVNKIDVIKGKLKLSLKELRKLLNSLSQKAFKGQLDLNTAVDLEVLLENDYQFFTDNSDAESIQLLLERLNKDELNEMRFYEPEVYDKAKGFVFELLQQGKVKQVFDEKSRTVKLSINETA